MLVHVASCFDKPVVSIHENNIPPAFSAKYQIKAAGMKPGIALNPHTPLSFLDWIIQDIEMVVLMTINPGIVGHKFIPEMLDKISLLRKIANEKKPTLIIELDGGVSPETIPSMISAGADALVCGNGTIFRPHEDSIENKTEYIRKIING